MGVIDESGFKKAGTESVGVASQWGGRLGKTENCQVGVFLIGVTPGGVGGLDAQLFLPETWAADRKRRKNARVPKEVRFQTKPQIGAEMVRRTRAAGRVPLDWIVADSLYGDSGEFLDALEAMNQRYLVEVKKNTLVWTVDPVTLPGKTPGPKKRKKLGSYRYREVRSVQEIAGELLMKVVPVSVEVTVFNPIFSDWIAQNAVAWESLIWNPAVAGRRKIQDRLDVPRQHLQVYTPIVTSF